MSQSKSVIFTALFCLLFCTTEIYALEPDELSLEKQETAFSLDGIVKSLDKVVNGFGKSLDGTVNGLGESLDGAMNGIGKTLDEILVGLGYFLDDTGEVVEEAAEIAVVAGVVFLYLIAETHCYHYGYGHHSGHNHYHRPW